MSDNDTSSVISIYFIKIESTAIDNRVYELKKDTCNIKAILVSIYLFLVLSEAWNKMEYF